MILSMIFSNYTAMSLIKIAVKYFAPYPQIKFLPYLATEGKGSSNAYKTKITSSDDSDRGTSIQSTDSTMMAVALRRRLGAVLSLVLLMYAAEEGASQSNYDTTYVTVKNFLRGDLDLTVHCKSADDDLGVQMLRHGDSYQFHFRPNIWGSTLFFCFFGWTGEYHYYDIYVQDRDQSRCIVCVWGIIQEGPCMLNPETGTYNLCDRWNPAPSTGEARPPTTLVP